MFARYGSALALGLVTALCLPQGLALSKAVVIEGATLVDVVDGQPRRKLATLVIEGDRIVQSSLVKETAKSDQPRVLSASDHFVLPGLADMHVHVWDEAELGAYLAHGVTTVRNMSGMPFHLDLARRIEEGSLVGPRLLTTGPILNSPGPNAQINHQMVKTAAEAREALAAQADTGYKRIKVYSNLQREPYEAILEEASKRGMLVTGHSPEGSRGPGIPFEEPFAIPFEDVLDDGFETIEHSESILWHGLTDRLDESAARELARRIATAGVTVTPTLLAHHNLVRVAESDGAFARRPEAATLNPIEQQTETQYIATWAARDAADHLDKDAFIGTLTRLMAEEGVPLVTGSDAGIFANPPGVSLIDELELLVRAGLTPAEVIAASTREVARLLGEDERSGCLDVGCAADLVIYSCDPTERISCARRPLAVVRRGRLFDRAELDAMLEQARHPDVERTLRNLTEGMAAQGTPIDPAALGL
ncbi:amidohydrolase family protein [Novosphingobium aquimarinum]|uniref:amidohydrolase family protein n=1 Tax=Novosphingobium aquimarinum TaxID=2682494 RepID=UPI0012EB71B7|nr:amidohydrolase family protein [Novosphingobium aquimarinum]